MKGFKNNNESNEDVSKDKEIISEENNSTKLKELEVLLKLTLHKYDEEERRNELIDSKNKSLVAFLGVMLTIECTLLPSILGVYDTVPIIYFFVLIIAFIGSVLRFVISMLYFIEALNYGSFSSVPDLSEIREFKEYDKTVNGIISQSIDNIIYAVDNNKKVIEEKTNKGKKGFYNLKIGVLFSLAFIVLFIFTFVW